MANTKSAQRQIRVSARRHERVKPARSQTNTLVSKAHDMVASKDATAAEAVAAAISNLDKAAGKGLIHANNAARHKSRLVKKLNKIEKPQS